MCTLATDITVWSDVEGLILTAETLDEPVTDLLLQPQQ